LAAQQPGRGSNVSAANKGRGTPTVLPADFLRIPGYNQSSTSSSSSDQVLGAIDDETLARMLQDELFSEELARNPDFAHLARGGGGRRSGSQSITASNARIPAGGRAAGGSAAQNPLEGVNLMQKVAGEFSCDHPYCFLLLPTIDTALFCSVIGGPEKRYGRRSSSKTATVCT
jgi:hypothetical protein